MKKLAIGTLILFVTVLCGCTKEDITRTQLDEVVLGEDVEESIEVILKQFENIMEFEVVQEMNCIWQVGDIVTPLYQRTYNTIFLDPIRLQMITQSNLGDYGEESYFYVIKENEETYKEYVIVDGDLGEKEIHKTEAGSVLNDTLSVINPSLYFEERDTFVRAGDVFQGCLSQQAINQVISYSGLSNVVEQTLFAADIIEEVPVTIRVNEDDATIRSIEVDLSNYIEKLLYGVSENRVSNVSYSITYKSLQNVNNFTIEIPSTS